VNLDKVNFSFTVLDDFCLRVIYTKCKPHWSSIQEQWLVRVSRRSDGEGTVWGPSVEVGCGLRETVSKHK